MAKRIKSRIWQPRKKPTTFKNLSPGTVAYTGKKESTVTELEIIDYSKEDFNKMESTNVEDGFKFKGTDRITWININGLNNSDDIVKIGNHFGLHPLIQEDIVSTYQRPKIDEYEEYLFIVFKMLHYNDKGEFIREHVSLVLGKDYVLTFQEADGDVFDGIRERLKLPAGRIRNFGPDYLMFAILDAVVDNYFSVLEFLSVKIEELEDLLFEGKGETDITQDVQELKKEILKIRKAVIPLREVISRLEKMESPLVEDRTRTYIKDLYDHIIQASESVDLYREMVWGLMDMYMTTISNKMNEVMKVLTIMASIFIPLTFMAGIYGMNFEHMPELHFKYGYYYLWGLMILVFFVMLFYFKRKRWL